MSNPDGVNGSTVRYPAFLTEDAPRPPNNQRSIEPRERIELLVECVDTIRNEGATLPVSVGRLFTLTNAMLRARVSGERLFSFIEFKAVVRCLVMDERRGFEIAEGRLFERRDAEHVGQRDGEAVGEEEIVRQIREAMAEVDAGGEVSVWAR